MVKEKDAEIKSLIEANQSEMNDLKAVQDEQMEQQKQNSESQIRDLEGVQAKEIALLKSQHDQELDDQKQNLTEQHNKAIEFLGKSHESALQAIQDKLADSISKVNLDRQALLKQHAEEVQQLEKEFHTKNSELAANIEL